MIEEMKKASNCSAVWCPAAMVGAGPERGLAAEGAAREAVGSIIT